MEKENYIEKMSEKELGMFLPKQMKETDVLSTESKKVLAVLIEGFVVTKKAREKGFLVVGNARIKARAGISGSGLMKAIRELELYNLIERHQGSRWKKGEEKKASEYIINWDNIRTELKQKTCEDLIEEMGLSLLSTSTSSIDYLLSSSTSSSSINYPLSSSSDLLSSKEIENNDITGNNNTGNKIEDNNPESFIKKLELEEGISFSSYLYNLSQDKGTNWIEDVWYEENVAKFNEDDFKQYRDLMSALLRQSNPIASKFTSACVKAEEKEKKQMDASLAGASLCHF